ncbi:MAG: winged helix-turn-helix domain-containing protein [Huintestinicola sp.]
MHDLKNLNWSRVINLFRMDLRKMVRGKAFYVMLAVAVFIPIMMLTQMPGTDPALFLGGSSEGTADVFGGGAMGISILWVLTGILLSIYIGTDYIGALLRRAKIASSRKLEIGGFVMDADEHTAYLNGEEISMTTREFSILYKLLSYPKKTFTRTQLMDEFWDVNTESGPRTVDVYMTKLRAKLSECKDFEIVTVHGLGYKAVIK